MFTPNVEVEGLCFERSELSTLRHHIQTGRRSKQGAVTMSVRTTQVYSVPLVYHDTDANQTLEQVVEALQQLDRVTTGVFGRVAARADATRRRLTDLSTVSHSVRLLDTPLCRSLSLTHRLSVVYSVLLTVRPR